MSTARRDLHTRVHPALLAPAILAAILTGCSGARVTLDGRAVQGRSSIFIAANESDPRLAAGGDPIPNAEVTVRGRNHDGPVLATATSGPDGRFSIELPDAGLLRSELALTGRRDGHLPARTVMFAPPRGSSILLVMEPSAVSPSRQNP